jgi:hypothetical protein
MTTRVPNDYRNVKDSGSRQDFGTGSVRDTQEGKGRYDLLPPYAIYRLARHFENGAKKYGDRNWEKGQPLSRYLGSAMRHLFRYLGGSRDEDHLAAVMWNVACYIQTEQWINEGKLPGILDDVTPGIREPFIPKKADSRNYSTSTIMGALI